MKKKLFIMVLIVILMIIIYYIYINISFNKLVNNTVYYENKINYNTNITLNMNDKYNSSKIKYEIIKSNNIKKILLSNYKDNKLENKIEKYIVNKDVYINDNGKYIKKNEQNEEFIINYNYLKKAKIKSYNNNEYKIKIKALDAYNMIYNKKIMNEKNLNKYIYIKVIKDNKNDFIKEISYNIDNLNNDKNNPLKYKVNIKNENINNHDNIKLDLKKE